MHDVEEGASPQELLIAACRQNNEELLEEAIKGVDAQSGASVLLNTATDPLGNFALHIAVRYRAIECLDMLLDQEGLEIDPLNAMDGDTPLHIAVRLAGELGSQEDVETAKMLLEAGSDPRLKNKHGQRPIDLAGRNDEMRRLLQKKELAILLGQDIDGMCLISANRSSLQTDDASAKEGESTGSESD